MNKIGIKINKDNEIIISVLLKTTKDKIIQENNLIIIETEIPLEELINYKYKNDVLIKNNEKLLKQQEVKEFYKLKKDILRELEEKAINNFVGIVSRQLMHKLSHDKYKELKLKYNL